MVSDNFLPPPNPLSKQVQNPSLGKHQKLSQLSVLEPVFAAISSNSRFCYTPIPTLFRKSQKTHKLLCK
jgi:hypothetical protein